MRLLARFAFLTLLVSMATTAFAVEPECASTRPSEELQYRWKLRGPLSWIAGLAFPTSGKGFLRTIQPRENILDTELRISGDSREDGFFLYHSQIDESAGRTLMTYDGYAWRDKRRSERTLFDYVKRLARIRRENTERVETRVKSIPHDSIRDVLTGIYFLRQNASQIHAPVTSDIYSGGKLYPVVFRPTGSEMITFQGEKISTRKFEITAAPGIEKKWPGGVKVWLSDDENHTPVRIEIKRDLAALQLDLGSRISDRGSQISDCRQ